MTDVALSATPLLMDPQDSPLKPFEERLREPGESVLAWCVADEGVAVLTEKRLCLCADSGPRSVPVTEPDLRYRPTTGDDAIAAFFESGEAALAFTVRGAEQAHLGTLLGNIKELREAHAYLEEAGLDGHFVPPAEPGGEVPSAIYQLMRLKELVNQGLLGDLEFIIERGRMIERIRQQGAARR